MRGRTSGNARAGLSNVQDQPSPTPSPSPTPWRGLASGMDWAAFRSMLTTTWAGRVAPPRAGDPASHRPRAARGVVTAQRERHLEPRPLSPDSDRCRLARPVARRRATAGRCRPPARRHRAPPPLGEARRARSPRRGARGRNEVGGDHQWIVDLVRDASGQCADARQALIRRQLAPGPCAQRCH
jgi:hypothetical protein